MANPFKEAEKAKKKAPGSKQEPAVEEKEIVAAETPAEQESPVETPQEAVAEKKEPQPAEKTKRGGTKPDRPAEQPKKDIFAGLEAEKPSGKTYAFYLSDENVKKLKAMAEKKGTSASKLLDHILSEVL